MQPQLEYTFSPSPSPGQRKKTAMARHRTTSGCLIVVTAALGVAITSATPAAASPQDPCGSTLIPVCAFLPVMPDLDHDIDLTKQPPADPNPLNTNSSEATTPTTGP